MSNIFPAELLELMDTEKKKTGQTFVLPGELQALMAEPETAEASASAVTPQKAQDILTGTEMFPDAAALSAAVEETPLLKNKDRRMWDTEKGVWGNVGAPVAAGAAQTLNSTVLGGTGFAAAQAAPAYGDMLRWGLQAVQPFLNDLGITPEKTAPLYSRENNAVEQAAKGLLGAANTADKAIGDWYTRQAGETPSFAADVSHGVGSSLAFWLSLLTNPMYGASAESLGEAGDSMRKAMENGKYDQSLAPAAYSFLTNMAANYGWDKLGFFNPMLDKIRNPWARGAAKALAEVPAEVGQETGQDITANATDKTIEQGGGFTDYLGNLLEEAKSFPAKYWELLPTVGTSTLITGGLGAGAEHLLNRGAQQEQTTPAAGQTPTLETMLADVRGEQQQPAQQEPEPGVQGQTAEQGASQRYTLENGKPIAEGTENDFVLKDGQRAWGRVTEELSEGREDVPVGDIRVKVGNEKMGLAHARGHEQDFLNSGYQSAEEFIDHTLGNFNLIVPVGDGKHFAAVDTNQPKSPAAILAWRPEEGGYDLISAYPARRRTVESQKKKSSQTGRAAHPAPAPAPAPSAVDTAISSKPESDANVPYGSDDLMKNIIPQPEAEGKGPAKGGNIARVRTAAGTEVETRYRVMEADSLIASNTETGAVNPDYPQELQPRQRDREASRRQINRIANNLDPELLGENRMASDGAPIVGADRVVESGNGRVLAIRQAYRTGGAENYRTWLKENAGRFGLDGAEIDGIKNPVLVRERTGEIDRAQFAREANEASVSRMSPTEQAKADAARMTPEMLAAFDPDRPIQNNREFVQMFADGIVGKNDMGNFMTSDGQLSQEGLQRMTHALFAKAYGNTGALNRLSESLDDETKSVTGAMVQAAPRMAALENAVEGGGAKPELSLKDDVSAAANTLAQLRKDGTSVEEYLQQVQMFSDDEISPEAKRLLSFFNRYKRSAKKITTALNRYAELAMNEGAANQGALFDTGRDKRTLLNEAIKYAQDPANYGQGTLFDEDEDKEPFRIEAAEDEKGKAEPEINTTDRARANENNARANEAASKQEKVIDKALKRLTAPQKAEELRQGLRNELVAAGRDEDVAEKTSHAWAALLEKLAEVSDATFDELAECVKVVKGTDGKGETVFDQSMFHGTRHNLNGGFDLTKIGTGEGAQVYGWGIYLAQARAVGESYRRAGANDSAASRVTFTTINGEKISYKQFADAPVDIQAFFFDLANNEIARDMGLEAKPLEAFAREKIEDLRKRAAETDWEHEKKRLNQAAADLEKYIPVSATVAPKNPGNLYSVEGPENYDLLDWDAPLSEQPEKVKNAIKAAQEDLGLTLSATEGEAVEKLDELLHKYTPSKNGKLDSISESIRVLALTYRPENAHDAIELFAKGYAKKNNLDEDSKQRLIKELSDAVNDVKKEREAWADMWGYSVEELDAIDTGNTFYRRLSDKLGGDKEASLWLNNQDVPGMRYLDQGSRDSGEGTRNFVIWNTDLLKIMGVEGPAAEVERYDQPANPGVDMDTTFDVTPIDLTREIPDQAALVKKLKSLVESGGMITRDELAAVSVGGRKKRDHAAHSSQNIRALANDVQEVRQRAMLSIDNLISQSVLVESAPNMKQQNKPNIEAYHRFYVPIVARNEKGENTLYKVRIVAEEAKGTKLIHPIGVTLYDLIVEDNESSPSPTNSASNETRFVVDTGEPSFKISLRDILTGVNDAEGKPYLDINGDPMPPTAWQRQRYEDWIKAGDPDIYHQIIGERGAAKLDAADRQGRIDNLSVARQMEEAGKDAKTIWLATGWERGKDGKWGYDILDGELKMPNLNGGLTEEEMQELKAFDSRVINGEALNETEKKRVHELDQRRLSKIDEKIKYNWHTLEDIYDAPELYAAYPQLKGMPVTFKYFKDGRNGEYSHLNGIALKWDFLNKKTESQSAKRTLVHEIQHAIQEIEGFAKGGDMDVAGMAAAKRYSALSSQIEELQGQQKKLPNASEIERGYNDDLSILDTLPEEDVAAYDAMTDEIAALEKQRQSMRGMGNHDAYKRLTGEVQARNASTRMKMTAEERRNTPLADTEDVRREDQILLFGSGRAESRAADGQTARGYTEFTKQKDEKGQLTGMAEAVVHMLESSDASTGIHEGAHVFLEMLATLGDAGRLNDKGKQLLMDITNEWGSAKQRDQREHWHDIQEKFAASVEKYLMKGEAPSPRLKQVFEAFKGWLKDIYHSLKNITYMGQDGKEHSFNISPKMRETLDAIFSAGEQGTENAAVTEREQSEVSKDSVPEPGKGVNSKEQAIHDTLKTATEQGDVETVVETLNTPDNPFIETAEPKKSAQDKAIDKTMERLAPEKEEETVRFESNETERRFAESRRSEPKFEDRLSRGLANGEWRELKKAETESGERMAPIRVAMRLLARKVKAAPVTASETLKHLNGLDRRQFDIFARKRMLDNLMWRKEDLPDADLPWGLTAETLKKEHERFTRLAEKDPRIMEAIEREEAEQAKINAKFAKLAEALGWHDLAKKLRNPHYFHHEILFDGDGGTKSDGKSREAGGTGLERLVNTIRGRGYLQKYKGSLKDICANYALVTAGVRAQMLQDIAIMETLADIKEKYDKAGELRKTLKPGERLSDVVPEGYAVYDPLGGGLVETGGGVNMETLIAMAAEQTAEEAETLAKDLMGPDIYKQSGLRGDIANKITEMLAARGNQLMVIPKELKAVLTRAAEKRKTNKFMRALYKLTHGWKLWTLYSPFRTIKYNLRNLSGDMDALLAGNPRAYKKVGRSIKDLMDVMFLGKEAEGDIRDYMERGWAQSTESHNLMDDGQLTFGFEEEEIQRLIDLQKEAEAGKLNWKGLGKKSLKLLNKYSWGGIQHLTEFREQILRYACYLSYKEQMEADLKRGGEGRPDNWGASLKEEVMAVKDIKDRAYKMANELMGAYDQVSETGQKLRRFAVPFYSWLEVNARRYWRLLKNGLTSDSRKDFVAGFMKGTGMKAPLYAYRVARTYAMVNLFSIAMKLFNMCWAPEADDDLPPEVQQKPHITFGHDKDGNILYFDRLGSTADIMDWIGEDEALLPFVSTVRDILNGQQTVTGWIRQMGSSAYSKAFNALNPMLKMPMEIATGKTYYPDATKPRMIRDMVDYAASAVGLSREVRALRGEPGPKYAEGVLDWLGQHASYAADPEEGAYFHILDRVRQFQERELGKTFDGAAITRRGSALRKLKTALRFNDKANVKRYLKEYYKLGGTRKGLKTSLDRMGPLAGLSKEEQKQFLRWLPKEERKYLTKANQYYRELRSSLAR